MAAKYKDFMIRGAFKASWTFLEAALILNDINPECSTFAPNKKGIDKVNVLYYWLVKENRNGYLPAEGKGKSLRTSPGDIIRHIRAHKQIHSKDVAALWEVARYEKNIRGMRTNMSWAIYEKARDIIVSKYPNITKHQVAAALNKLPRYYRFPNETPLSSYSYETLLKKLRKSVPNVSVGRPSNSVSFDIDISQIAAEIRL